VGISEKLTDDMKTSMKAGDSERTGVLRLLRGAIKNDEIKFGHVLIDDEVLKVLAREAKQRRDSIEAYQGAGRSDLADHEEAELQVINEYLPVALDDNALGVIVDQAIAEVGAKDIKHMGSVIGAVMKKVGPAADGGTISRLVKEKLA
jgi:uncharacterized protein YqeY